MSGICGLVDFSGAPADEAALRLVAEAAAYRGPEGLHTRRVGQVGLAHLLLDRTPESVGVVQPIESTDGDVFLTADVRLDNRAQLLAQLERDIEPGERPASDAEVILAAYRRWGTACAEHLLGDFAFALWDAREERLVCARDALGIKSFNYARVGDLFLFASEAQ